MMTLMKTFKQLVHAAKSTAKPDERTQAASRQPRHCKMYALEPRIMFDAAAVETIVDTAPDITADDSGSNDGDDAQLTQSLANHVAPEPASEQTNEIVFVENDISDYQQLIESLNPGLEVHVLDASQDGLSQINQVLQGRSEVQAIHVLTHGSEASIQLGAFTLTNDTLALRQDELSTLGSVLAEDGDVLIYGCQVAGSEQGQTLISELARITGADIAASLDATGAQSLGGDWDLEYGAGQVESTTALSVQGQQLYESILFSGTVNFSTTNGTDLGTEATDGEGGSSDISGVTVNIFISDDSGTATGGNIFYVAFGGGYEGLASSSDPTNGSNGYDGIVITAADSSAFDFNGFYAAEWVSANTVLTVEGFKNGSSTGFTTLALSAIAKKTYGTADLLDAKFGNVDKILITGDAIGTGKFWGTFNNFVLADPVVSDPTVTSVTSSTADGSYKIGDTISLQVAFSEAVTVSGIPQLTLETGTTDRTIDYVSGSGSDTLTFNYTVQAGDTSADLDYLNTSALSLNGGSIVAVDDSHAADLTLASPGAANSLGANKALVVDGVVPTVSDSNISISGNSGSGGAFKTGDTVTATWNNTAAGDNNGDIGTVTVDFSAFGGGSAVSASNSAGMWTATYTITSGSIDTTNLNVSVAATDTAGNATTMADTTNATVDNRAPTVTDGNISISGASGTSGAYKVGDTVTATWDNTASGDNNSDISGVTVDFSAFGGGAAVAASNSSGTWSANYTITSASLDASNRNVSVTATDDAGNATTTADTTNAAVDNQAPTVTDGNISITGATGTGGAFKIGDTVTATWNNTAGGDNNADISGVTVDFSAFGGGAAVAASNNSSTWTATYTITSGSIDTTNLNVSVTATDDAGNATTTADTTNATVDNQAPTVTDAKISISGASGSGGAFKIGDIVTATWDNTASGDNNSDITAVKVNFSAFGGGAAVAASNSSGIWTATYTITSGSLDATNVNVSVTATDDAGNATTTADTTNATVDNQAPTVTDANISISGATGTGSAFKVGDTVTATWNNTAGGDNNGDISGVTVDFSAFGGGTAVVASNSSGTWTASYTIASGSIDTNNLNVSVTATDNAGNTTTTADTANAILDNQAPIVTEGNISISGATGTGGAYKIGDTVTATWNNTAAGDNNGDIDAVTVDFSAFGGGSAVSASNSAGMWTATYVITSGSIDTNNCYVSVTAADDAGNATTTADTTNAIVDNTAPTVTNGNISISGASGTGGAFKVGDTITATWNNTAGGDNNADISGVTVDFSAFGGGAAVAASSSSGTWTATYMITSGSLDATNRNVSVTATDDAGNATTTADTTNATVDNQAPTTPAATLSVAENSNNSTTVGTVTGGGADGIVYSLVDDAGGRFSINSAGAVTVANGSLLNYEADAIHNITVRATDNAGNTTDAVISVTITNVNEDPVISALPTDVTVSEDLISDIDLSAATLQDVDSGANPITLTITVGAGSLTASSDSGVVVGGSGSSALVLTGAVADLDAFLNTAANIRYIGQLNAAGDNATTLTLTANDGGNSGSGGGTTINLGTVNVDITDTPDIISATYDYQSNQLVVTGNGFSANSGAGNDVDVSKLTLTGEGGHTYTLSSSANVEIDSATQFTVTLSGADIVQVEALLNKNGTVSAGGTGFNLATADDFIAAVGAGDTSGNAAVTVTNYAAPQITSASYDTASGQLVVTGTNFVVNNGVNNDIDASAFSITGGDGNTHTLTDTADIEITSATQFTLTLNASDKLVIDGLLNKNGAASGNASTYNLAAAEDWMFGAPAANDITDLFGNAVTVSNVAIPTITSAQYNADAGLLAVTASNLFKNPGAANDIDISQFTFTGGVGNASYTLTSSNDIEITSANSFTVTLSGTDKIEVDALLDRIGTSSSGGSTYNLAAADNWLTAADPAVDISDANNAISVSITPKITSATYDAGSGTLVVTGTNLQAKGDDLDIDVSKLTFTGEGGVTYALTDSNDVELDSTTQFTVLLSASDKAAVTTILNKNGTHATDSTAYNLAAADDWDTEVTDGSTNDLSNALTVSNVAVPSIAAVTYDAETGTLTVSGSGFLTASGGSNDIDVSKFTLTGEGGQTYQLTDSDDVDIDSATQFTVVLSATDRAAVNLILNKNGGDATYGSAYKLIAGEDWSKGADAAVDVADQNSALTVNNVAKPTITSATYNENSGVLVVTGSDFLTAAGAANDIDVSKLTFSGEAGATYTLTDSHDVDITSASQFTVMLSAQDKLAVSNIVNKNGTVSAGGSTYNLAAQDDWAAGADQQLNIADLTNNGIDVTVNQLPSGSNIVLELDFGDSYSFSAADFNFSDSDSGDSLQQIKVTALPTAGKLTLNGVAVTLNQTVSIAAINAGKLVYAAENGSGTPLTTFQFAVGDGLNFAQSSNTVTVNVAAILLNQDQITISSAVNHSGSDTPPSETPTPNANPVMQNPIVNLFAPNPVSDRGTVNNEYHSAPVNINHSTANESKSPSDAGERTVFITERSPTLSMTMIKDTALQVTHEAFGFDQNVTLSYQATAANGNSLPSWIKFDSATGKVAISEAAHADKAVTLIITATDNNGHSQSVTITLEPVAPAQPEVVVPGGDVDAQNETSHREAAQLLKSHVGLTGQLQNVGQTGFDQQSLKLMRAITTVGENLPLA